MIIKNETENSRQLILNTDETTVYEEIRTSLESCVSFNFNVAFMSYSGLQLFLSIFDDLNNKNVAGKIITSTYLNFSDPKAMRKLLDFNNIELRVYTDVEKRAYHSKAYLFEYPDHYKVIIGSSNLTAKALKSNIEWNVKTVSKHNDPFIVKVLSEFKSHWDAIDEITPEFLDNYTKFIHELKPLIEQQKALSFPMDYHNRKKERKEISFDQLSRIKPNIMQQRAMRELERTRKGGSNKSLIIAATGTGKTYLAAFDVKQVKPRRVLFVVHREIILKQAMDAFKNILGQEIDCGFLTGNVRDLEARYLFATNLSLQNHLQEFKRNEFDYIIIDEAHHATGNTYQSILNYLKPKFLLGMTATPERVDSGDIFSLFDNQVAIEIRLHEAMQEALVVPFHYFGITDITVDLKNIDLANLDEIAKRLKVNKRVDFIIDRVRFYGHDGNKTKGIGFCVTIDHARYMAEEFNKKGIYSTYLSASSSESERLIAVQNLEDSNHPLKFIFVVDLFNEGVDIPSINLVLMLRPTNSPIIFIQQLGRGLRIYEDKEYLTVLDFIGNHNKAFLIAIALKGSRYYDKDSIRVAVAKDFNNIPGNTFIQMDRIAKEKILKQLELENFSTLKYLKEEYLAFKGARNGLIPYHLMDYLVDGAPNPMKFIRYDKSYMRYLFRMENLSQLNYKLHRSNYVYMLEYLSAMLPLRRPYEFLILRKMMQSHVCSVDAIYNFLNNQVPNTTRDDMLHALECLNLQYLDKSQKNKIFAIIQTNNDQVQLSNEMAEILQDDICREYIADLISFGLYQYFSVFKETYYGLPFLKLYEQYSMQDLALLSNYRKKHSSYRGSGLIVSGNDYFLFVDLHKNEDIKSTINYKDRFIDRETFQWESPNKTRQKSERGQNIIFNKNRGINLHLFIRKCKKIDRITLPYIYVGKMDTFYYENETPIMIHAHLENRIPNEIYQELTIHV